MAVATKNFIALAGIRDNVAILKDGSFRAVLMVGGLNFDLFSEQEKQITIGSWQQFLNGLDFSIQVIIHSRNFNIEGYLANIEPQIAKEENELLKLQGREYVEFVKSFSEAANIMSKTFYIVVPYDSTKFKTRKIWGGFLKASPAFKMRDLSYEDFKEAKKQLELRVNHITNGLVTVGLRAAELQDQELFELFYNYYNPTFVERMKPNPDIAAF